MVGRVLKPLRRLFGSDSAATAIEYCLIAGLIALAIAGTLPQIGANLVAIFARIVAAV